VPFDAELYERLRTSQTVGASVVHREETTSTMDDARAGAAAGQPEGTVYVADVQTGGRGRLGREWLSADSGLWVTFHLVTRQVTLAPLYSLVGALAVTDAVRETALLTTEVKWPNDVMQGGLKLAGILAESTLGERVDIYLGIGINIRATVMPEDVASRATSIEAAGGAVPAREDLLAALSAAIERYVQQLEHSPALVVEQWRRRLSTLGQRVTLYAVDGGRFDGEAVDVSLRGELMLRSDDGQVHVLAAGDVTMAPPSAD
jgi:BirA family transcriptional regulator, biotin operon repressor / biotin---[acetyl-CoA-carboxylase] ligase